MGKKSAFAFMSICLMVWSGEGVKRSAGHAPCENGMADIYPCQEVDLLSHFPLSEIGGGSGSDIWGWTDPLTGTEYALMGRSSGTSFFDLSDPEHPVYLGNLATAASDSSWRDIKVYENFAFIVADFAGTHGMQIFDLTKLRNVASPPATFTEDAHYSGFGSTHNIVINEETGFAFAVGISSGGNDCNGGLHMIDINDPLNPTFAGCFSTDAYTHDAQCVVYQGPDSNYQGKEVCFNCNEDTLTIVDVQDKANPVMISRNDYGGVGYTHQGWLTDDHNYFLLDDELDEDFFGHNTRTLIWDVSDLANPVLVGSHMADVAASDHNQYVHQGHVYQANYRAGLRILRLENLAAAELLEVAYFDTRPASNANGTSGAWSVYPYFASGTVIVSDTTGGFFSLRPYLCTSPALPESLSAVPGGDNTINLTWTGSGHTYRIYRSFGACPSSAPELIAEGVAGTSYQDTTASGGVAYAYQVTAMEETGRCESDPSTCASATTTGVCNASPQFGGLTMVENQGGVNCQLLLSWSAATANCDGPIAYNVYRSTDDNFTPGPANILAEGLTGNQYPDGTALSGITYHYVVRSKDTGNGVEDENLVRVSGTAYGDTTDGPWKTGGEFGDPGMVLASGDHVGWELVGARIHAGDRSFFSTYSDNQCSSLLTPQLRLSDGESSQLSFWSVYEIEDSYDGGVVSLSIDDGLNWTDLPLQPGYPGSFNSGSDACNYKQGTPSFTGTNLNWTSYTADLSAYNGVDVRIRWTFSTDGNLTGEGWYVDDIQISHTQIPGPCETCAFEAALLQWPAVNVLGLVNAINQCTFQ